MNFSPCTLFDLAYEAKQVPAPYPPSFQAVAPTLSDSDTLGTAQAKQTEAIDLEELGQALAATQPDPGQRQKILAEYTAVRHALTAHAQWWRGATLNALSPLKKPPPQPALASALTVPEAWRVRRLSAQRNRLSAEPAGSRSASLAGVVAAARRSAP